MIQSALEEVIVRKPEWLSPIDLIQLAESFIEFDSDSQTCKKGSPSSERQLQGFSDQDCNTKGCFDCAATAGACMWNPEIKICLKPK